MNKLAWNARRYPDDQLWVAEEPIAAKFLARSAATISSRAWVAAWEAETVSAMKDCKDIDWVREALHTLCTTYLYTCRDTGLQFG